MFSRLEKSVMPWFVLSLLVVPFVFLSIGEAFVSLYNPSLLLDIQGRLASAAKPLVYGLCLALALVYMTVVRHMLAPLFEHLNGKPGLADRARRAALGIPFFLIVFNAAFWVVGTIAYYAMHRWKVPNGVPLGWNLALKMTEALFSSCLSALLLNVALFEPKRMLGISYLAEDDKDAFVENKDFIICVAALLAMAVRLAYIARYFMLRPAAGPGPSSLLASTVILSLGVCLSTFWLMLLSRKERNVQLELLDERLRHFAQGEHVDLRLSLSLINYDGVGRLAARFNGFAGTLRAMVAQVNEAALMLESQCEKLSGGTHEAKRALLAIDSSVRSMSNQIEAEAEGCAKTVESVRAIDREIESLRLSVEKQAEGITESSASIEQMLASIQNISDSMGKVEENYQSLGLSSEEGSRRLDEVVAMAAEVSEKSTSLNNTNAVIAKIAAQTNLLAMNAAIEAAHAGQAGAGFSVVADEIRALAEHAARQSKEVGHALADMKKSVDAIAAATGAARDGFADVRSRIAEVSRFQQELRVALGEQAEGGLVIREALSAMNGAAMAVREDAERMNEKGGLVLKLMNGLLAVSDQGRLEAERISHDSGSIKESFDAVTELVRGNTEAIGRLGALAARFKV